MRVSLWAAGCFLAAFALAGCTEEEGVFTSPEGQQFAFLERPDAEIVAIQLAFPMDWVLQEGRNPNVPTIAAEVMVSGGAEGYSAGDVMETMQDLNAEAFLYPQFATLRGGLNVAPDQLDQAVALANAVLRAPTFDGTWMARSIEGLRAHAVETNARSSVQGYVALRLAMLGDTGFAEAQSPQNLGAIGQVTADMARAWHRDTVVAGRVVVAVAGPISAKKAGEVVDNLLAGLPRATGDFPQPKLPPYRAREIVLHVPQAEKTTLTLLSPIPPTGSADDFNDTVAAMVLGGDEQAILFEEIRTKLRASYGLLVSLENYARRSRIFVVSGEVDTGKTAEVRDVLRQVYAKMGQEPLPAAQVERQKSIILDGLADWHNNTTGLATSMVEAVLDGQDPMTVTKLTDLIDRVTPQSIQARWQTRYAKPEDLMILAVSPDANSLPGACVIREPRQVLSCP